jgi:hypothetical protein
VPNSAIAHASESEVVGRLARFFPEATPVSIPVTLSRAHYNDNGTSCGTGDNHGPCAAGEHNGEKIFLQSTVIEFGTPHEVLFTVDHPLEFADHVFVESNDGSLSVEASVVAVQYHPQCIAVAARFLQHVPNWIVKS